MERTERKRGSRYNLGKPQAAGLADLSEWRGRFRHGYTEDDIASVLNHLSALLDIDIVCVWEKVDEFGFGGDSHFVVFDDETVRRTPEGFDALLLGYEDVPAQFDLALMRTGEIVPNATPEDFWGSDAYPHNGVWALG